MPLGRQTMKANNRAHLARWGSWFLIAAIFSVACWFLSQWQFSRQDEVSRANGIINKNYALDSTALEEVLQLNQSWTPQLEFRAVTLSGKYLPGKTFLVRNRPFDGNPGFLQIAAFKTDSGSIFWVERGWLPTGTKQDAPDNIPQLNDEQRSLTVRLRPTEKPDSRQAPSGQLPNIDLEKASASLADQKIYLQAYGRLVAESPELDRGQDLGKPQLSEGNHLSYAFQWIIFGLMAFGAVIWNIGQDRRRMSGQAPRKLASLNRDVDGEIEDKILEK